jgi:hypothetical protein
VISIPTSNSNNGRIRLFDLNMPIIPDPNATAAAFDPYYNNFTLILDVQGNATAQLMSIGEKFYFENLAYD